MLYSTSPEMPFDHADKVGHVFAFLVLGITGRLALFNCSRWFIWAALFGLAFSLEYLQGELRPLRVFSIYDAYANAVGIALSVGLFKAFKLARFVQS